MHNNDVCHVQLHGSVTNMINRQHASVRCPCHCKLKGRTVSVSTFLTVWHSYGPPCEGLQNPATSPSQRIKTTVMLHCRAYLHWLSGKGPRLTLPSTHKTLTSLRILQPNNRDKHRRHWRTCFYSHVMTTTYSAHAPAASDQNHIGGICQGAKTKKVIFSNLML